MVLGGEKHIGRALQSSVYVLRHMGKFTMPWGHREAPSPTTLWGLEGLGEGGLKGGKGVCSAEGKEVWVQAWL